MKKLILPFLLLACLALALLCLAAVPGWAALTIVQSTRDNGGYANSYPFSLSSPPAVGNMLLAFLSHGGSGTAVPPAGQTWVGPITAANGGDVVDEYYHIVVAGDGTSYTFTTGYGGQNDFVSGTLCEISGQATTNPINLSGTQAQSNSGSYTTAAITPTVLGCLALYGIVTDNQAGVGSVSSGWTNLQTGAPLYHTTFFGGKNALTIDISTAISATVNFSPNGPGASIILLIAPGALTPSAPSVTTQAASGVTGGNATLNGNITSIGSASVTAWGFVWNTTGSPTLSDHVVAGSGSGGTGAYTGSVTGLPAGPIYAKAYATNSVGTAYGSQVSLTGAATKNGSLMPWFRR